MIDLNCDMGEGFGSWSAGHDEILLQHITAANIACGFHAGDPVIMQRTVQLALRNGVAIGAHPGFPDLQGFGRRNMQLSPEEVHALVLYQIGALQSIAKAAGGTVKHVKPHGALYNMAAQDLRLATAIATATAKADQNLILYGLSGSALIAAGKAAGLRTQSEVFADRSYQEDGTLTPRSQPGAMIDTLEKAVAQALQMVREQTVTTLSGKKIALVSETLCLHGDGKHAVNFAIGIRNALEQAGIRVQAP